MTPFCVILSFVNDVWFQSKFRYCTNWKHTTVDALQCVKTFPKHGWQIIIRCRMDKKPLLNHKNSHRFLSPFRCINWEYFASFCNFVHLFFLKIQLPPWSDRYWVWCCCFWDHCLSLEHHIESAAGGKLLRLFWSKRTHQFPRYLVPYLLSCSPMQRCQTRTWKGWFNISRSHFQKIHDPWTW